jgi:ABC-2 type transport system permease protein
MKSYLVNTIIWIISLCGLMLLMMFFYPFFRNDLETYTEFMNNFPETVKVAMGLFFEDFSTPVGYYSFVFTYCSLLGAIQAMNLGVGILSKEEREHTADFLMTKPVSRKQIVTAKLASALTILITTNIIYQIVCSSVIYIFSEEQVEMKKLLLMNIALLIMQLVFFSIGLAVTAFLKKVRSVLPLSLALVFSFFAISAFAVTSKEDKLRFITPFQYFTTRQILDEASYEVPYVILSSLIIIICITLSYNRYIRKNIPTI